MLKGLIERAYAAPVGSSFEGFFGNKISPTDEGDVQSLVTRIISWILYIAGVLAFVYLVISGITYITAGGNAEQAKKGQQGIINAVIGVIIIVLAWVILNAVTNLATNDAG